MRRCRWRDAMSLILSAHIRREQDMLFISTLPVVADTPPALTSCRRYVYAVAVDMEAMSARCRVRSAGHYLRCFDASHFRCHTMFHIPRLLRHTDVCFMMIVFRYMPLLAFSLRCFRHAALSPPLRLLRDMPPDTLMPAATI